MSAPQRRVAATRDVVAATRVALAAATDDPHGAFVAVTADSALAAAVELDRSARAGRPIGSLHGMPLAVKDAIDVAGVPTLGGPSGGARRSPSADAAVCGAARAAGAVIIGKTSLPDLALDVVTPGCVNPHDPGRISGGSSGGSAAAVAAGIVRIALGTDTGGSVRIPAALTGVVGLRPTYGTLATEGVLPLSPAQDTVGVIAADAGDCLRVFQALRPLGPAAGDGPRHVGVAVADALWAGRVAPAVAVAMEQACARLDALGHRLRSWTPPDAEAAPAVSYVLLAAEAAEQWVPRPGYQLGVRAVLAWGSRLSAAEVARTRALAARIRAGLMAGFDSGHDVLLLPTTAATAAAIDADDVEVAGAREPLGNAYCRFTTLASVTGLPAISVPCGTDEHGLPIGLQLVGPPHSEALLCRLAGQVHCGRLPG